MKKISEYMTKLPHSIEPHSSVETAKKRMYDLKVTHLPVLAGGKIVGLLSERDFLYLKGLESVDLSEVKVGDAMIPEPVVVKPERNLSDVCQEMLDNRIGSVLVEQDQGLVGIFTDVDALKVLAGVRP